MLSGDSTSQAEYFTCKQPPHQTNRLLTLVVAGNSNINMCKWRVSGGECNNRDVDVRGFSYWLVVSARISHNKKTGLAESSLNLIGECSWGETSCNWSSTSG